MRSIRSALARRADRDAGFTLVELVVVVIIIGILAAVAIPRFLGSQDAAKDSGVKSDLRNYATAAETNYVRTQTYPNDIKTFSNERGADPSASKGNTYRAFVVTTGANRGYVIVGMNNESGAVFAVSSYKNDGPFEVTATNGDALGALPAAAAITGATYGVPSGVAFTTSLEWNNIPTTPAP